MSEAFLKLVNMSISAGWLVLAVLFLRLILKKAPRWVCVLLWGMVALRLICPISIESGLSLIPSAETVSPEIIMDWTPEHSTGIAPLDQPVEPGISTPLAPEPSADADPLQRLIPAAAGIWLLGMLAMLSYTAVSYLCLRRKLRTAVRLRDNIFQCETVRSPFVLGIVNPRIYLPYTVEGQLLPYVVAHEQAHIRRKDHWWKPLGFLLLSVYWFHPLLWVAYYLLCRDIELACDEKVIAALDSGQKADYSQALVACSVNRRSIAACPLAFGEVGVKERVKSVMHYKKPGFWVMVLAVAACGIAAVCFLTDPVEENPPHFQDGGHYLRIGAEGVKEIQISLPDSGGGVIHADGTFFKKGEKVYLEQLLNTADLRGLSVTALGQAGEVLYSMSVPEDASSDAVNLVIGGDGWMVAPMSIFDGLQITGKTYTYENEGILGDFTVTLYDNGTFHYYEGMASSYYGVGTWTREGSVVTLCNEQKQGYDFVNRFTLEGDDLIFMEQGSSNFLYVKVKEGERFRCTGQTVQNIESAFDSGQDLYLFRPTISTLPHQPQYFETWQPAPDPSEDAGEMTDKEPTAQMIYEKYLEGIPRVDSLYMDLNQDGEPELIIDYRNSSEVAIVTIVDGEPVTVLKGSHICLCENGIIAKWGEGSGGETVTYYRIDGREPVIVDVVVDPSNELNWYHTSDPNVPLGVRKEMDPITKEEGQKICAQYPLLEDSMPYYLASFYPDGE